MKHLLVVALAAASIAAGPFDTTQKGAPAGRTPTVVDVYKTPTCGCCSKWVDHLRAHGFTVKTTDFDDVTPIKTKNGVPAALHSCHTALVGGYVVEGHVPAGDIEKLLKERPKVAGIAVPGMPVGSPGMEIASGKVQPYSVLAFQKDGSTQVFAQHR